MKTKMANTVGNNRGEGSTETLLGQGRTVEKGLPEKPLGKEGI